MFESFATRHWFSDAAKRIWSDESTLQSWLDVEAALALSQAELGLIPQDAAQVIQSRADAAHFDLDALADEIAFAQHPLVPVLRRFEALCGEPAAGYIHWGATTQNIFDTASALQMQGTHRLLASHLDAALRHACELVARHADTPMAGRTHGQHALPMTFGLKVAGWIDELERHRERLHQRIESSFPACMGGAIGSFAATGTVGRRVESVLAARLRLQPAGLSMRSSYDRAADYIATLGLLAGTSQKIGQDIVFLQRTEVGEVAESFHMGKIGSSTMAQKRNPSTALLLVSLARLLRSRVPPAMEAMVRMDEGDSSATNVTDTLLPEIAIIAVSLAETLSRLLDGLHVNAAAMQRNLELTRGLISSEAVMMQLGRTMGRHEAHHLLYDAAQKTVSEGVDFATEIRRQASAAGLPVSAEIEQALDPAAHVGESVALAREVAARVRNQR
jgi:adenylosuccinate lyase/3-carboxy-cis,cis-muconate cycloisomerase